MQLSRWLHMKYYIVKSENHYSLDEIGEKDALTQTLGPKMAQRMIKDVRQIWERMKQAQDHHKSYIDKKR